jgi:hypothetical protein
MKHLLDDKAKAQLKRLKKLDSSALGNSKNKLTGMYQKEPYTWIAFDNRKGCLWVGTWEHQGACIDWLDNNPEV